MSKSAAQEAADWIEVPEISKRLRAEDRQRREYERFIRSLHITGIINDKPGARRAIVAMQLRINNRRARKSK